MPFSLPSTSDTEKLQRRNRELSILNTIAEALNREVDVEGKDPGQVASSWLLKEGFLKN